MAAAHVRHHDLHHVDRQSPFDKEGTGAPSHGVGGELVAVLMGTDDATEQAAGLDADESRSRSR